MYKVITNKEAKLAWAYGGIVEFRNNKDKFNNKWKNIYEATNGFSTQEFDDADYEFRLKTILNTGDFYEA